MMVVSKQSSRHKMWTEITRPKYERGGQRYASDVTDAVWVLIEPHMPAAKPLGRPREFELRALLDAILYIARTGCQWRMLLRVHFEGKIRGFALMFWLFHNSIIQDFFHESDTQ